MFLIVEASRLKEQFARLSLVTIAIMAKLSFVTLIYLCSGILFQAAALPKIHSRHSHPTHEPQLDNTCGNPPSPVEIYLGTAAKLRKEDSQDRVKRQTVNPDDPYSCDENKPCSNGKFNMFIFYSGTRIKRGFINICLTLYSRSMLREERSLRLWPRLLWHQWRVTQR